MAIAPITRELRGASCAGEFRDQAPVDPWQKADRVLLHRRRPAAFEEPASRTLGPANRFAGLVIAQPEAKYLLEHLQRLGAAVVGNVGGSPPYAMSSNALATCHTNTGARCHGYSGDVAPPPDDESGGGGGGTGSSSSSGNCTPGYSPCMPPASDYDCAGGGGDGPKYTGRVQVTGSDPYGLDSNGDGVGCE